ncbi:hypothetical protein C8J57DRAFT_1517901 [Mycena rebaudengoi]|nr:hypothetical protein C8J57DRAFT_1517901 [Mycena rebaudengoi]
MDTSPAHSAIRRGIPLSVSLLVLAIGISDLPLELWTRITLEALPDRHHYPGAYSSGRAAIACVCKDWHYRVYTVPSFWCHICINHHISPDQLTFAISHCPAADLHIRIVMLDVSPRGADGLTITEIEDTIRVFMAILSPHAHRWKSFYLLTEDPVAFVEVQSLCLHLHTPRLQSLSLLYSDMRGYSTYDHEDPVYDEPTVPVPGSATPFLR